MTCTREQRGRDVWFFCTSGGATMNKKPPRCSVCGGARASLLCDGPREDDPSKTCDAPIHRRCSVRVAGCSRWEAMELLANRVVRGENKRLATAGRDGSRVAMLEPAPDSIDFCPNCAERFRGRENERQAMGHGAAFVRLHSRDGR